MNAASALRSVVDSDTPECAEIAAAIVGAEPSCRYGPVCQMLRSVGVSSPVNGPPRRWPLVGLSVPTSCSVFVLLSVNAAPLWHDAQFCCLNTVRPACASAVSAPPDVRYGLAANWFSEATYAANASRSALKPAFGSPSGWLRVPTLNTASDMRPVPPANERIWPSKSCTSSKFEVQCKRPCAAAGPRKLIVLRRPSPIPVISPVRPSEPPSLWHDAQLM